MPNVLHSISWCCQHLQFIEHTRFEVVTLNLPSYENEIHLWFTSHFHSPNNDTLQHRALHDSRISGIFDPYRFPCSPQANACVASWNTPFGPLYLHPSRSFWTSHWFVSCMKSSLPKQIHHSIFICKLSNLRQHMHINSCLIHFSLACFLRQQYSSHMTSLSNLRLCNKISCLILIAFTCHMNPITSWISLL